MIKLSESISQTIQKAVKLLFETSDSPFLDAEILLAHTLQVSRVHLLAYAENPVDEKNQKIFQNFIKKRQAGIPIAYLVGQKEFWSRNFTVTPDTLIPRPETELLVELTLQLITSENKIVADMGTGTGIIAITLALEHPTWQIHATDISEKALQVAKQNAEDLHATNIIFHQSDWFGVFEKTKIKFDAIVSNPPYMDPEDNYLLGDIRYEPQRALIAEENGLQDLRIIIEQAKSHLQPNGLLLLEHGHQQGPSTCALFETQDYKKIKTYQDLAGHDRVTVAQLNFDSLPL